MKVVIVGGKLQGLEAAYLARQIGWHTVLVDKDCSVPAAGICDEFVNLDVLTARDQLKRTLRGSDLVLPAVENKAALLQIQATACAVDVPMAYDSEAYAVSSSKLASDCLFQESGIPTPLYWPMAKPPLIVKPSGASGSQGVLKINSKVDLAKFMERSGHTNNWVIQEYLSGPSYSLEVMGCGGEVISYQVTELEMDAHFDCKRVWAPAGLGPGFQAQLRTIAAQIAHMLNLTGIMDIEVIEHGGSLRILEIDARLPSQTPVTVWHSTGINMLEHIKDVFVESRLPNQPNVDAQRTVVLEQVKVTEGKMESLGEHMMATVGPLQVISGFWGADVALTNYRPGRSSWVATLIFTEANRVEVETKRSQTLHNIKRHFGLEYHLDLTPDDAEVSTGYESD
ncbi:ATP-grasp fold profile [Acididesulfobacillus acetoxydans]|uniref:3-methylornithine--L-lysine ligase n=1 Tax=Acididesulfobacillus acetoxydans TaxID=1561005 RepID=A0A8S0X7M2_9FIRM|nr:3-methylornithine--L-lysine ligase PylC [Acididesulfobacillus acetoxydans]CAA7603420.1 ATP-grasp fold profile [Acididesulfobacillus acetoxydans]CEJ07165.1 3-methylornithine--L-lysine ligase [Acididesulfobacillus acetoxydans]